MNTTPSETPCFPNFSLTDSARGEEWVGNSLQTESFSRSVTLAAKQPLGTNPLADQKLPRLIARQNGLQLDFTFLEGKTGDEFAALLDHRIVALPPMTIVRVYDGEYQSEVDATGRIQTGGLQQCIAKLDRALVRSFEMTIHVVHYSSGQDRTRVMKQPDWLGEIHVHSIKDFGVDPHANASFVRSLCRAESADLLHLHTTDSRLASILAKQTEKIGLAVTFHNGLYDPNAVAQPPKVRSTDFAVMKELLVTAVQQRGIFHGSIDAIREILTKVRRRLFRSSPNAVQLYDTAAAKQDTTQFAAASLVAVSKHNQEEYQGRHSVVIGDPMETERFNPSLVSAQRRKEVREYFGLNVEERVLVCHGRVEALKGQQYLPEVAAKLKQLTDEKFKVLVIGPSRTPQFVDELQRHIDALGVNKQFIVHGGCQNEFIRDVLAISDIMLFPTQIEALGGAAIEASLMEVPVVGSRIGGVPEVVRHTESGFLVEVGDTAKMAHFAAQLLSDQELREQMGRKGREAALGNFDAHVVATQYVEAVYGPQVLAMRQQFRGAQRN